MVRTTLEIASEIEELKQHLEGTTQELEERLEPVAKPARWAVAHRRELAIVAISVIATAITARILSRLR